MDPCDPDPQLVLSMTTLRQISAVLPPEQAWSLWLSRRIVAGIMDAFGPSLAGASIEPVDVHHDGRRVVGEWVRAPGVRTRLSPEAVKAMKHVARFIDTSMRDNGIEAISGKAV